MELMIAAGKAVPRLQLEHGLAVDRVYTGSFMTSLDMTGFSISVMKADQRILQRLDAATKAPYWPVGVGGDRPPAKIPVPIPPSRITKSVEVSIGVRTRPNDVDVRDEIAISMTGWLLLASLLKEPRDQKFLLTRRKLPELRRNPNFAKKFTGGSDGSKNAQIQFEYPFGTSKWSKFDYTWENNINNELLEFYRSFNPDDYVNWLNTVERVFEQYCDKNIEQYYNYVPIFDKPTSDEVEDGSEEDEALTLMILEACQMGGVFAHQHGCGRCTQTEARIEDGLLHDGYFCEGILSLPVAFYPCDGGFGLMINKKVQAASERLTVDIATSELIPVGDVPQAENFASIWVSEGLLFLPLVMAYLWGLDSKLNPL
ncbi:dihydroxyacetone kinase [Actinidia rufa]|uniref:Dihydroxyacetone kinase n=1 Tax=Actinidia rufa TaxID=165716 RepID=A0A7J0F9R1_9ERIC|nr:dihydroxyacetone kinase [Actinidia rufa]